MDVAIIGAGISGVYAAWSMRNYNLSVSLYEASNRIGGQIYTRSIPNITGTHTDLLTHNIYRMMYAHFLVNSY